MELSHSNAIKIVSEINSIIDQKINIINKSGIIIASTSEKRVGEFHEGAKKLIDEKLDELIVNENNEFKGAMNGVNFPLKVQDEIIGVVGVTGNYDEVSKYCQIIKRITEILILDATIKEQESLSESIKNRFLTEWFNSELKNINPAFIERGFSMNIDITIPRRVMVMAVGRSAINEGDIEHFKNVEKIERTIQKFLLSIDNKNAVAKMSSHIVCVVTDCADDKMYSLASLVKKEIKQKFNVDLYIGIDEQYTSYLTVNESYQKAQKALEHVMNLNKEYICFYHNIDMEIFINEISDEAKTEYVRKIFKGFLPNEIDEAIEILKVFYKFEGSINNAAAELHMHKNTLQYKIKKIYSKTGIDPRCLSNAGRFIIAMKFYRNLNKLEYVGVLNKNVFEKFRK